MDRQQGSRLFWPLTLFTLLSFRYFFGPPECVIICTDPDQDPSMILFKVLGADCPNLFAY